MLALFFIDTSISELPHRERLPRALKPFRLDEPQKVLFVQHDQVVE